MFHLEKYNVKTEAAFTPFKASDAFFKRRD